MRPKKPVTTRSGDLFRARLDQIINLKHELVQLAGQVDWGFIDGEIAPLYSDKGRPGISTRFAIGLLLLKHIYEDLTRVTVDKGRHHGAAQELRLSGFPTTRPSKASTASRGSMGCLRQSYCPCRQARGDDGGPLCLRQAIQPSPEPASRI
jgi:hypothetical protein